MNDSMSEPTVAPINNKKKIVLYWINERNRDEEPERENNL